MILFKIYFNKMNDKFLILAKALFENEECNNDGNKLLQLNLFKNIN